MPENIEVPVSQSSDFDNQPIQINIGAFESVCFILVFIFGMGLAWGSLRKSVSDMEDTLKSIKPDLKDFGEKIAVLWEARLAISNSPRQLSDFGKKILEGSGIKEILEEQKQELINLVKAENPTNPYDAEMAILKIINNISEKYPETIDQLKKGAFEVGVEIDAVLFVGGIHFRNLIFKSELGFDIDEIDKHTPKKKEDADNK